MEIKKLKYYKNLDLRNYSLNSNNKNISKFY